MFELLFKYPWDAFQRGHLELAAPWLVYGAGILALAVLVPTLLGYGWARGELRTRDRVLLSALRVGALAALLLALLQPVLVVPSKVPERNVLAVLLDDSRSMRIADSDGARRADFVRDTFLSPESSLGSRLEEKFNLRRFRFGAQSAPVEDGEPLRFASGTSDLAGGLNTVRQSLSTLPLAGVVVVTDGADNGYGPLEDTLRALRASGTPVYTVGLGLPAFARDIEVTEVQVAPRVLKGTALTALVTVHHHGYPGASVPLIVEDEGRVVHRQTIELSGDGEPITVHADLKLDEAGPRRLLFRIPVQEDEALGQNNAQRKVAHVDDRRRRVLYFEGEPRFELKFARRAVKDDENLHVVTLLRTAENKFYRLGIDDPQELASGFPKDRETLFDYHALVLGSVEASYFNAEQLQMIVDFVSRRGGGLLVLGGKRALTEGGYDETPVADLLPIDLDRQSKRRAAEEVVAVATEAGGLHPVTRMGPGATDPSEPWSALPPLTIVNSIGDAKPGATTLLEGLAADGSTRTVMLALQRYGRGRVIAFPVQNSWLWQMHGDVPLEDQTHETLWRQMLRWLVHDVPGRLELTAPSDPVAPGDSVTIVAELSDTEFRPAPGASLTAVVTSPVGERQEVVLEPRSDRDGVYETRLVPGEEGLYELQIQAREDDSEVARADVYIQATHQAREYHRSQMRNGLLQRIATETGGAFYTRNTVDALADDVRPRQTGASVIERRELWDMPVLLLGIIGLICVEWCYRRWRALP